MLAPYKQEVASAAKSHVAGQAAGDEPVADVDHAELGVSLSDATIQPIRHPTVRRSKARPPSVTLRERERERERERSLCPQPVEFGQAAHIWRRGGVTVEATNAHSDYFVKNLSMLRAEERLGLGVFRPVAFTEVRGLA